MLTTQNCNSLIKTESSKEKLIPMRNYSLFYLLSDISVFLPHQSTYSGATNVLLSICKCALLYCVLCRTLDYPGEVFSTICPTIIHDLQPTGQDSVLIKVWAGKKVQSCCHLFLFPVSLSQYVSILYFCVRSCFHVTVADSCRD